MTQGGMDGHSMEIVKGVNLCTSLIFTSGSRTEGPQKGRELWFERSPTPTNNAESTKMHHLETLGPFGYENDCGGFGDVILDVTSRKLTVERNDRFEDYATSTYEV